MRSLVIALALPVAAAAQVPPRAVPVPRPALVARIDSIANAFLTEGHGASVAIGVVRGRDVIALKGYGLADRTTKRAAGPSTVYEIGSITKQFTASAIMRLVEAGKVRLDDDLSKYVPGFPLHGRHVAIRNLLNHTSGIHNYTNVLAWGKTWADDLTPDSLVAFVANDTLDFAPGTQNRYSNTGYVLLGMVIEKASGKPYATFLDEQFFKPLHLTQTSYCLSHPTDTAVATGYTVRNGVLGPADYLSMTHPFSAGALCSSVHDLLMWQAALHGGLVVRPASYRLMTTPDTLTNGTRLTYGFGLGIQRMNGHAVIMHGGGINGFTTAAFYFPGDSLQVIVLTNSNGDLQPEVLAGTIARATLGLPLTGKLWDN